MPVLVSLLRAVNLVRHQRMAMDDLRALYVALGYRDARTYVQSGNVVFGAKERDGARAARRIEQAIEREFGFRTDVIVRTAAELREVIARNPFAACEDIEPGRLLVTFLAKEPDAKLAATLRGMRTEPEETRIGAREIYTYFPGGVGRPGPGWMRLQRALVVPATGRNWNTVRKLMAMAEEMQRGQ